MILYRFIFLIFFFLSFSSYVFSESNKNIVIEGNEFIDDEVIYSIIGKNIDENSSDYINKIIKSLFETGNFKNIEVEENDTEIIIKITENSRIKQINLIGNKRFKRDVILERFNEKDYFRYVNEIRIDSFIEELKKLYLSYGYNQIDVQYKIIDDLEDSNAVNLNFYFSEGSISKVNKIYFVGNTLFDKQDLMSEIKSNENNYFIIFRNENYKEFQIKDDLIRLEDFYRNNGFRDVQITYKSEYINKKNKFNVYFYINEGKKYQFGLLDFDFISIDMSISKKEEIKNILEDYYSKIINKDNIYNHSSLEKMESLLSEFLYDNGTIFFNIRLMDKINDSKVNILIKAESIQPKYVNQINIFGNSRTLGKVIRREVVFSEGDAINSDLIRITQRNLDSLGIFRSVQIDETYIDDNLLDIDIYVEEKSTGEFQIGLSFGTLEGATFISGLKEKNIAGLGREIDLTINTSNDNTKYNFGLVEPIVYNNNRLDFIYGISYEENDYSSSASYNLNSFTTHTGVRYTLIDDLTHAITVEYRLKEYLITNSDDVSSDIEKLSGNNADILLNNNFIFNELNSFLRPTKGTFIQYQNVFSPATNSDNGYMKNTLIHKKYFKFDDYIFSVRTKIGNIFSLQSSEIATDDKFSLGGRWLRGFDSYGVGPRKSRTSYVGGKNVIVSKFDISRPLNKESNNPIDINLFTDIGTVFENKNTPTSAQESIRSSYGFGLKFYSPIGPIGFSWAFPIGSESYDIERMFLFSIGNLN